MKHRIRAGVIILQDDKVLLVEQSHPITEDIWWTPPGGGREVQDTDIFACAIREAKEECGLDVELDRIIYIREFYDVALDTLMMEIYFLAKSYQGQTRPEIEGNDNLPYPAITRVAWVDQESIKALDVFPEILTDDFWEDVKAGFPGVRYLPMHVVTA
ncbi:MAG: NUDIX hydrolase [Anaerolineaceae bacterium]|nr:NUDIX hydrolase [Anaerolineaceae bacterium]